MTYPLRPSQIERLCEGSQACKRSYLDRDGNWHVDRYASQPSWTAVRRAEVVVDGETVHEDSSQAHPFDLWEALNGDDRCHCGEHIVYGYNGNPRETRFLCETCDAVRCDAYPGECAS